MVQYLLLQGKVLGVVQFFELLGLLLFLSLGPVEGVFFLELGDEVEWDVLLGLPSVVFAGPALPLDSVVVFARLHFLSDDSLQYIVTHPDICLNLYQSRIQWLL